MKLQEIIKALNTYYTTKYSDSNGFFIGKESFEPTKLGAYKVHKVEIFYRTKGKNIKIYHLQLIDRYLEENKDIMIEKFNEKLLADMFINLNEFDKCIDYEIT